MDQEILELCESLYIIGKNDGKDNLTYFPLPAEFYKNKIITVMEKHGGVRTWRITARHWKSFVTGLRIGLIFGFIKIEINKK